MKTILVILFFFSIAHSQVKDIYKYGSKVNDYIALHLELEKGREKTLTLIDSIFQFALTIADSNIADALLFCCVGTMTYPVFKVRIPVINVNLHFPVFSEIDSIIFKEKMKKLPSRIFEDSPDTEFSDKDKLVHFFSTAYLSYIFGDKFSVETGKFVEEFEEIFKIDGKIDQRDLRINQLGAEFGKQLRYKIIYPSIILVKEKSLSHGENINN